MIGGRNLPNVSQGCAEHRTSTNHFVLASGHNTDSNYRHQTIGLPTARYEKSFFCQDLARLNGDTKPKLTSPNSSINQDMQDAIRSSTRISRHVRSEGKSRARKNARSGIQDYRHRPLGHPSTLKSGLNSGRRLSVHLPCDSVEDGWYIDLPSAACGDAGDRLSLLTGFVVRPGGAPDRMNVEFRGAGRRGFAIEGTTRRRGEHEPPVTTRVKLIEFSDAVLDKSLFDVPAGYRRALPRPSVASI